MHLIQLYVIDMWLVQLIYDGAMNICNKWSIWRNVMEICKWCNWYGYTCIWIIGLKRIYDSLGSDINHNGPTGHIQWQLTYRSYTMTMDLRVIYICTKAMGPSGHTQWNPGQIPGLICHRKINWIERHMHMNMKLFMIFNEYMLINLCVLI